MLKSDTTKIVLFRAYASMLKKGLVALERIFFIVSRYSPVCMYKLFVCKYIMKRGIVLGTKHRVHAVHFYNATSLLGNG